MRSATAPPGARCAAGRVVGAPQPPHSSAPARSVVVLAGELLREAEKLVDQRIHPMTIIDGWRLAVQQAREALDASAIDHSANEEEFRQDLINIAKTTLSSKLLTHEKDHFARLAVDAVLRLKDSANLDYIQIIKKNGGSLRESFLDEGFIMDKKIGVGQPKRVENAKILIANTSMDTDKIKVRATPQGAGHRPQAFSARARITGGRGRPLLPPSLFHPPFSLPLCARPPDLRLPRQGGLRGQGCRHRGRGESQDEGQGGPHHRPRHQLLRQQAAHLQLARAAARRERGHGHRARRLRRRRAPRGGDAGCAR